MGLSNYPSPVDGGVVIVILVNALMSITIVKDIFGSLLRLVGIHISWFDNDCDDPPEPSRSRRPPPEPTRRPPPEPAVRRPPREWSQRYPSEHYMEEFHSCTPTVRFDTMNNNTCKRTEQEECSVCLTEFVPEAEINHLTCGHVFHKLCLEKWLKNWKITCPLCRTCMITYYDVIVADDE